MSMVSKTLLESCNIAGFPLVVGLMLYGHLFLQSLLSYWNILKATIILLPLLGMTWVFGLLAVNENTAVFAWLFTIFNSLQAHGFVFLHILSVWY
ncbi:Adhesion G protein-coupled receptor L3 [Geodia barretti]|uniref:Adhesion G protein-coupled receptor L3 n=1 Tax=Geodia barretti TaxID=519541 RepID=A0AA35TCX8_GEOBA|nr:Adhesion G protein-coupled receptor L3 [Geodia barretti]